ncbi:MAG: hypothetical protein HQK50_05920 [Oligoflexia bacterium]|nr:hypothetical protein [Oligoflexia bacterium]MBF0365087.1 hypothetical protein [Oligoflexia bacterium]
MKCLPMVAMMMIWLLLLSLAGCASGVSKKQKEFRDLLLQNKFNESLSTIDKLFPVGDDKSKLIHLMEKGMTYHRAGKYFLSAKYLQMADTTSRELYTQSISKSALTVVANDTVDNYYGAIYERSLIHFYLALDYYLLYTTGSIEEVPKVSPAKTLSQNERNEYLQRARAEMLAWDSLLSSWKEERKGSAVFKDDLLAKILGGMIHESFATPNEHQTALQLYIDGKELLLKNYNAYVSYNQKALEFQSNFSQFPGLGVEKVKKDFITQTPLQNELVDFLDYKIFSLAKRARPEQWNQLKNQLAPREEILAKVEKNFKDALNNKNNSRVILVLQNGFIPEKFGDKYIIGMEGVLNNIEDPKTRQTVQTYGATMLTSFAANQLGLLPPPGHKNEFAGTAVGLGAAYAVTNMASIAFELPKVKATPVRKSVVVEIFKKETGELITTVNLPLSTPLGDIAEQAIAEDAGMCYVKTGTRVALKHLTAIAAAYGIYKMATEKGSPSFMAKAFAYASYVAASKAIEASERADTRYWSSLPNDIRISELYLPSGEYEAKAKVSSIGSGSGGGGKADYFQLGFFTIPNGHQTTALNYILPQYQ